MNFLFNREVAYERTADIHNFANLQQMRINKKMRQLGIAPDIR